MVSKAGDSAYYVTNEEWDTLFRCGMHITKREAGDFARSIGWRRSDVILVSGPYRYCGYVVAKASMDGGTPTFRIPDRDRNITELTVVYQEAQHHD